jgi:hypothetical protein
VLLPDCSEVMRYGYYRGFCSLGIVFQTMDNPHMPSAPCIPYVMLPHCSEVMHYGCFRGFCSLGIMSVNFRTTLTCLLQPSAHCISSVLLPDHSEVMCHSCYRSLCSLGIEDFGKPSHASFKSSAPCNSSVLLPAVR